MPRHELPRHTTRRIAVAGVAAEATTGTPVTVGVMGIAAARDSATAPAQCLLGPPPESAPPAASTRPPAEQPPAEQPPAEQPPAQDTPGEQPPADPGTTYAQNPGSRNAEVLPASARPDRTARVGPFATDLVDLRTVGPPNPEPRPVRQQRAKVPADRRH